MHYCPWQSWTNMLFVTWTVRRLTRVPQNLRRTPGRGCVIGPREPAQPANYLLKSADFCRPSQQTQQIQLGPEYVMAAENTLGKLSCQTLSTTQCRVNTMHINKLIRDWHSMGAYCHNPGQPKTKSPGVVLLSVRETTPHNTTPGMITIWAVLGNLKSWFLVCSLIPTQLEEI